MIIMYRILFYIFRKQIIKVWLYGLIIVIQGQIRGNKNGNPSEDRK
jgi:hypothetical protein